MTATIELTLGYVTVVDDEDADLEAISWSAHVKQHLVYASHSSYPNGANGKKVTLYLHRLIVERVAGCVLPSSQWIDHEDGDPLNNRRSNLRLATRSQNQANAKMYKNNKSGFKGVIKEGDHFRAKIVKDNRKYNLGKFDTVIDAHEAYKAAALELYGEFARFK